MTESPTILLIDDNPDDREVVSRLLRDSFTPAATIVEAEDGKSGLVRLRAGNIDCVILDFSMPGADGVTVMREIALRYPDMAIVMITGEGNEKIAAEAFRNGAQDYVIKSHLDGDTLAAAINNALSRKAEEVEILRRANHDELTGLGNRRLFNDRLDHVLDRTGSPTACAVIFFDLNGFKLVNDTHGHDVGDALLKEVAERAKQMLRPGDTLARLGGDEFVILLENLPGDGTKMAKSIAARLTGEIRDQAYRIKGNDIVIGASVGLAIHPLMADNRHDLLRIADQAMYEMKRKGAQEKEKSRRTANG